MRRLAILIAVVIGGLCLAQLFAYEDAHAATLHKPYLTMAHARTAITAYERGYWKGSMTVKVRSCRRHSPRQVSCLAEATRPGETILVRDWATILAHGIIRVHPGDFTTVITL
jgi:hypothetical protein